MIIGGKEFMTKGHTYVMGILNVTPDSFSDGGEHQRIDEALLHTQKMIHEGADIIDVGGESTRPGHQQISTQEEIDRTAPVIERIKNEFDIPVSIDSYKADVARAAIESGADMVNDIWGLRYDNGEMARLIADYRLPCCLMHNRSQAVSENDKYEAAVREDMAKVISTALNAGIDKELIILDPGVGFGKTYEQNLEIIGAPFFYMDTDYPVLLGTSRKSVIGLTLDLPVNERLEGTLVTTMLAVQQQAMFVRVHDVKENVRTIKMMEAIQRGYNRN